VATQTKTRQGQTSALSDESLTRTVRRKDTSLPPRTPKRIRGPLRGVLAGCHELTDAGVSISISVAYHDADGQLTGLLIADRETAGLARGLMSPGVQVIGLGDEVQA